MSKSPKYRIERPRWNYSPVMQFAMRLIRTALIEINAVSRVLCPYTDPEWMRESVTVGEFLLRSGGEAWDRAVMARDWIRRASPDPNVDREGYLLSFDHCCAVLELNADAERLGLLSWADSIADFDTDEVWARIDHLASNPPDESEEPLFDAPRVCPELDQGNLFAALPEAA